jgi:hypothetical protein
VKFGDWGGKFAGSRAKDKSIAANGPDQRSGNSH